jgi:hypothetical protein
MENGTFIDDFPIKTSICQGFSMAMLNNQMVYIYISTEISTERELDWGPQPVETRCKWTPMMMWHG